MTTTFLATSTGVAAGASAPDSSLTPSRSTSRSSSVSSSKKSKKPRSFTTFTASVAATFSAAIAPSAPAAATSGGHLHLHTDIPGQSLSQSSRQSSSQSSGQSSGQSSSSTSTSAVPALPALPTVPTSPAFPAFPAFPALTLQQPFSDRLDRLDHPDHPPSNDDVLSSALGLVHSPSDLARLNYNHQRMPGSDIAADDLSKSAPGAPSPAPPTPLNPQTPLLDTHSLSQIPSQPAQSPQSSQHSLPPRSTSSLSQPSDSLTPSSSPSRPSRRVGFAVTPEDLSPVAAARPRLSSSASSSSASTPSQPLNPRKPSPGLAARLKALGFGAPTLKTTPPTSTHNPERVGRLPEDQIRQIDQNHQAASSITVIERRGRPWKGPSSARLHSVSSLISGRSKAHSDAGTDTDADTEYNDNYGSELDFDPYVTNGDDFLSFSHSATGTTAIVVVTEPDDQRADVYAEPDAAATASPASSFLPEIKPVLPLEMDTNKYRLPDHTNGNGTKVQLDTRQQHIERDSLATLSSNSSSVRIASPDIPPPPLPKDTPPSSQGSFSNQNGQQQPTPAAPSYTDYIPDAPSYFNPLGLQRPGSIYTLSRVSFANQLAQLTSLQLPDAESLSSRVSAIPTAQAASRALIGAAEQIRNWISKASEVIGGLDSDDDVEWAAAGGREGLEEVENAIIRFEELINVYVGAIEELQCRPDIASVTPEELQRAVVQMESIMEEWSRMRSALQSVKAQVEIAMEWEELWGMVLGDIQNEMDDLSRLVFEMEERRHKSIAAPPGADGSGVDIGDLETIVEESQSNQLKPNSAARLAGAGVGNNRLSISLFPASPASPEARSSTPTISQDDSSLLALFARMQPLRASLDFLPMRLSVFDTRANSCFPTACEELEERRSGLDASYKKLEKDAESLRKELGEDRWVTVFRGAARQAQKMYESVERSVAKLKEGLDAGMHLTNQPVMAKKIESYETKKLHYGPAIERVLAIIDKGVKDRLTLNGEILRLHAELQTQWDNLRDDMHDIDLTIEELQADDRRNQQLRDSVSSMLSNDRSTVGSGHDTPHSSPPSSVIMSSLGFESTKSKTRRLGNGHPDNKTTPTNRRRSVLGGSSLPQPSMRQSLSSSSAGPGSGGRKPISRFSSSLGPCSGLGSGLSTPNRDGSVTPVGKRVSAYGSGSRPPSTLDNRPRWNSSTSGIDTGHNFKPLSLTTPSPYTKTPPSLRRSSVASTPRSASSLGTRLPMRSPLGRASTASPEPASSSPGDPPGFRDAPPYRPPRLVSHSSAPANTGSPLAHNRRASLQPPRPSDESPAHLQRPASSMATGRRSSLLPNPHRNDGTMSGRVSPQALAGARFAMRKKAAEPADNRPKWRP
ncbi:karyogamy protein [Ophiostoma piceae UAMH 11346]|uniref:Karyogamy protein n=1 Tax=Ophiostoma piceae (strain UAMH 11346) TaxID=1262450 RepID=S3BW70_OPHP1|nr:karyogamy protein [Ophiostoma piceae UAMH 11346]